MNESDFYDVLDEFDSCMLLTFTPDGRPVARPMAIARRDGSALWFVAERGSRKVDEVRSEHTVAITVQDSRRWAAATGTASVTADRSTIEQLWSAPMKAWFPAGPTDLDLVALRVDLEDGEYWDVSGGKLVRFAVGLARSVATGARIDADEEGDHDRVDL
jgi:general stress protein 26